MDNNDLFIDTMDKINTLAKSRGFVNGNDWAKTAARKSAITEVQLSSFEDAHALRNLMAHGHAKDIVISPDTLSVALNFLTALAGSNLTPAAKAAEINWDDPSYLQPGDFILFPYFQGFVDPRKGILQQGADITKLFCGNSDARYDEQVGFLSCVPSTEHSRNGSKPPFSGFKNTTLPQPSGGEIAPDMPIMCIVLRPSAEVRMRLLSYEYAPYVHKCTLLDGKVTFALGYFTERMTRGADWQNIWSYDEFSCRAYCVPVSAVYAPRIPVNAPLLKLQDNYFFSFPPKEGQPYYREYKTGEKALGMGRIRWYDPKDVTWEVDRHSQMRYMRDDDWHSQLRSMCDDDLPF